VAGLHLREPDLSKLASPRQPPPAPKNRPLRQMKCFGCKVRKAVSMFPPIHKGPNSCLDCIAKKHPLLDGPAAELELQRWLGWLAWWESQRPASARLLVEPLPPRRKPETPRRGWTEKQPGQLRRIRDELRVGVVSSLSSIARQQLALIASRPGVMRSFRMTTSKRARLVIDDDVLRREFHAWAAGYMRKRRAAAARRAEARAAGAAYDALEAALLADEARGRASVQRF
jgi:hypothetical protein